MALILAEMNRCPLVVLLSAVFLGSFFANASAQTTPAIPASQSPDLTGALAEYEKQEQAIDQEILPALKAEAEKYNAFLGDLKIKLDQAKRVEVADKVKAELGRFSAEGMDSSPSPSAPAELRSAWTA